MVCTHYQCLLSKLKDTNVLTVIRDGAVHNNLYAESVHVLWRHINEAVGRNASSSRSVVAEASTGMERELGVGAASGRGSAEEEEV